MAESVFNGKRFATVVWGYDRAKVDELFADYQNWAGDLSSNPGAGPWEPKSFGQMVAGHVIALAQSIPFKLPASVPRMGWLAQNIIKGVLTAYNERDAEKAVAAWQSDEEVDETYSSLFRELLTHMMEDPRNIGACTHMLFIAKNIERSGDHATNIAEVVFHMVTADHLTASVAVGTRQIKAGLDRVQLLTRVIAGAQAAAADGGDRVVAVKH